MRIFFILLLFCSSCTSSLYKFPERNWQDLSVAEKIKLQKLAFNQSGIESFRFLITVRSKRKDERVSFRQAVVLTKTNNLTIETYPIHAAYLLNKFEANEQTFLSQDFQEETREQGQVTPDVFEKYFSIPLTINELLAILTARVSEDWLESEGSSSLLIAIDRDRESFANSQKTLSFQLDSSGQRLSQFSKYSSFAKKLIFTVSYLQWQEFQGKQLPQLIQLSLPRYDMEVSIAVKPIALN